MTFTDILAVYIFQDNLQRVAGAKKTKKFIITDSMKQSLMKVAQVNAQQIIKEAQPWLDKYGFRVINGRYDDTTEHLLPVNNKRNHPYKDFQRAL